MRRFLKPPAVSFLVITLSSLITYLFIAIPPINPDIPISSTQSTPSRPASNISPTSLTSTAPVNFISSDGTFRFTYPAGWTLGQVSGSTELPESAPVIDSWSIKNQSATIEFVIIDISINPQLPETFACSNPDLTDCVSVLINGVEYNSVTFSDAANQGFVFSTQSGYSLYIISVQLPAQSSDQGSIDQIINTIQIINART